MIVDAIFGSAASLLTGLIGIFPTISVPIPAYSLTQFASAFSQADQFWPIHEWSAVLTVLLGIRASIAVARGLIFAWRMLPVLGH